MDAVKHFDPAFIGDLLDDLHDNNMNPGMVVGEYFDSNVGVLNGWVNSVLNSMDSDTKSAIDVRAFDFGMRDALKNACDVFGYDVRNVFNSGMVDGGGLSGFNAVTFINNHDFRDEGQPVQNDPILGYAYILTNNQIGMPCIFYPDYFGDTIPHAPTLNLSADIDALISAHQNYIFGSSSIDQLSRFSTPYTQNFSGGFASTTLFFQMMGGPENEDVLVAINFYWLCRFE
jgi:alpha-amylase